MKNIGKKVIGAGVATLLVTTAATMNASAATHYKSYAESQYFTSTGQLLGDQLVDPLTDFLEQNPGGANEGTVGAIAVVDTQAGTPATSPEPHWGSSPLSALEPLTGGLGDLLGSMGVGAIGSYAKAENDTSHAASGLVTNEGIINLDTQDPGAPANATLGLTDPGMPLEALAPVANVILDLGAAGSSAQLNGSGPADLDYAITGGGLDIDLVALRTAGETLGQVLNTLTNIELSIPLVASVKVVGIDSVLDAVANSTNNGVSISLTGPDAGLISVDIPALLESAGVDINNLPRNSALLPIVVEELTAQISDFVNTLVTNVTDAVQDLSVELTVLDVVGTPPIVIPLGEVTGAILAPLQQAVDGIIEQALDPLVTQVGSALAGLLTQLEDLVDVRVNVQHFGSAGDADAGNYVAESAHERIASPDGVYAISALRVTLLSVGDAPLLALNLANSLVGPNSAVDVPDTQAPSTQAPSDQAPSTQAPSDQSPSVQSQGGYVDGAVDTLPSTGASNLWPFWLLGLLLVALGSAALINEKRRAGSVPLA